MTGGILPTGIYDCDLTEIEAMFVYNKRRETIWTSFSSYLAQIKVLPEVDVIYVDGSFITDKELPKDIDIVLEFSAVSAYQNVLKYQPHLFHHDLVKQVFNVDAYWVTPGNSPNNFRDFFQLLRPAEAIDRNVPAGTRKGILKISVK